MNCQNNHTGNTGTESNVSRKNIELKEKEGPDKSEKVEWENKFHSFELFTKNRREL